MSGLDQASATTAVAPAPAQSVSRKESWLVRFLRQWGTILVIILTGVAFSLASPWFLSFSNLNNILFSMIVSCMVSMGLTFVVVVGSFDLSVGLTVTTASVIVAFLIPKIGPWAAIVGGLYYGLAGLGHAFRGNKNFNESVALFSNVFIFAVLAAFIASRGFSTPHAF